MSEDSPRWPGTQGGPGLDFSPYRKPEPEGDAAEVKAEDESAAEQTVIASPATPASPASPCRSTASATSVMSTAQHICSRLV